MESSCGPDPQVHPQLGLGLNQEGPILLPPATAALVPVEGEPGLQGRYSHWVRHPRRG